MKNVALFMGVFCTLGLSAQNLQYISAKKPVTISGSIQTSMGYYNSSGFNNTMKPFQYSITASPTITLLNGIQIPFNFVLNQGSTSLTNPFYQFGVNPHYKGWKGYFGWTNMTWGEYVLNGKTFLGAGSDLQLGILRLGGMYGRLNPAVQRDTTKLYFENSQFERTGYAARIGIGTEKNHFDIMMLRAQDDPNSVTTLPSDGGITPAANLVFGIKNLQSFMGGKLQWHLEASAAGLTRDLNGKNYEYDTTIGILNTLNSLLPLKYSTSYAWAGKTKIDYRGKYFGLGAEYYRIQPEYTTFGTDYMMNDQQRITLKENFRLKNGKNSFVFSQYYQTDNLTNKKAITTGRFNFNNLWNFNPNQTFGMTTSYGLFVISQSEGNKYLNDSLRLFQFNHNFMLNPRLNFFNEKHNHNFSLMVMYQGVRDENVRSRYRVDGNTFNINLNHNLLFNSSQWNINSGLNWLHISNDLLSIMSFGPTVGISKSLNDGKINLTYSGSYLHNLQNSDFGGSTITNSLNASYAVDIHHSIRLNFYYMLNHLPQLNAQNELRSDLGYTYTF